MLTSEHRGWIARADTLFVASAHPEQGADASHRGGRPGFVQFLDSQTLRIPDYAGNNMFNSLGNFESFPHAGLAFVDFEQGRLLQLTGRPVIHWDIADPDGRTGGSGRFWDFEVEAWRESALALRLEWEFLDYSPLLPQQTHSAGDLVLQVAEIHQETDRIKRFRLRAFDDAALPTFTPGAHLPVTLELETGERVQRHYSILSAPDATDYYEIAVLNETRGRGGSRHLHESVRAGDQLMSGQPRNEFPLADTAEHSILIAGGIGITPILSMLRSLQAHSQSRELHYSARRWSDLAFRRDIEDLVGDRARFYASQEPGGSRMDLQAILSQPDAGVHIYACGPRRLITSVRDAAADNGWPTEQIHFESFGAAPTAEDRAITVTLARSGTALTVPATRSILDTLLDAGHAVPHDCKRGECSLCTTQVLEGVPEHRDLCLDNNERKESMCVCVSRARTGHLTLDL
jgi:ferredoxin-NADP reductase